MAARRVCIAEAGGSNPPESINSKYGKLNFSEFKRAKKQEKIELLTFIFNEFNSNELKIACKVLNKVYYEKYAKINN